MSQKYKNKEIFDFEDIQKDIRNVIDFIKLHKTKFLFSLLILICFIIPIIFINFFPELQQIIESSVPAFLSENARVIKIFIIISGISISFTIASIKSYNFYKSVSKSPGNIKEKIVELYNTELNKSTINPSNE